MIYSEYWPQWPV